MGGLPSVLGLFFIHDYCLHYHNTKLKESSKNNGDIEEEEEDR